MKRDVSPGTIIVLVFLALAAIFFFTACHKSTEVKTDEQSTSDVSNDKHEETYQDAEKNTGHSADTAKQTQTETQKGPVTKDEDVIEQDYGPAFPPTPEVPVPPRVVTHSKETKTKTTSGETTKKQSTGETGKVVDTEADKTQTSAKIDTHEKASATDKVKTEKTDKTDVGLGWKAWLGISAAIAAAIATALLIGYRFVRNMPWVKAALGAVKGLFGK